MFVVAGLFGNLIDWFELERAWEERLAKDRLAYFRAVDCEHVRGPFEHFRSDHKSLKPLERQRAEAVRSDLIEIILVQKLVIAGVGMVMSDFNRVVQDISARTLFHNDPYFLTYWLAYTVVADAIRQFDPEHFVAFVCDEHETHSQKALASYVDFKDKNVDLEPFLGSLNYMDDKKSPAIQAADLIAFEVMQKCRTWLKNETAEREQFIRLKPRTFQISACDQNALNHLVENNLRYLSPNVIAHGK